MSRNVKILLDKLFPFGTIAVKMNMKEPSDAGLLTIDDLSLYLKVTRRTIYDWLKHNKIPAIKLVGQWRFRKETIDAWIEHNSKAQ